MKAVPIPISWSPDLPIFASEDFLKAVSDHYGWLGGIDPTGQLRCILPYTVIRKGPFAMVRLRVETLLLDDRVDLSEEKQFLNSAVDYFRSFRADVIIPSTTNAVFRTYPDGADAAPYGSYIVNLRNDEAVLWKNISKKTRQNINTARRDGVHIRDGIKYLQPAYQLINDTFARSQLPFMSFKSLQCYMNGLGDYGKLLIAEYKGIIQSCVIYAFSDYSAYAIYGGNAANVHQGACKMTHWEAFLLFKKLAVNRFDFVGARIDPPKGSKQDGNNSFKQRMGAQLIRGYMWKFALRPWKALAYSAAVRVLRGGDIVDQELRKLVSASTV